ncbi:MAG: FeoB-associated Cys-rich membrane protein [Acidobacteriota bacterium]|nr:FeoB-associated Cys-rich membrane protein [Acidobacteriota bacterium]
MVQELIVFAIVAGAVIFLGRNVLNAVRGKKTCGSCPASGGCGASSEKSVNGGLPFEV